MRLDRRRLLEERLSRLIEWWPILVGAIFMTFVLFLPKGIWGTFLARIKVPAGS